jgi:hypothetical protein
LHNQCKSPGWQSVATSVTLLQTLMVLNQCRPMLRVQLDSVQLCTVLFVIGKMHAWCVQRYDHVHAMLQVIATQHVQLPGSTINS